MPTDAERVQEFRTRRGWTQTEAAAWYGVAVRTWRRWERGEGLHVPTPVLKRLATTRVAAVKKKG